MLYHALLWLYTSYRESATATIAARLQASAAIVLQFLALLSPESAPVYDRLTLRGAGSVIIPTGHSQINAHLAVIPGLLVSWPSVRARSFDDAEPIPSVIETGLTVYTGFPLAVIPSSIPTSTPTENALVTASGSTAGSTLLGAYLIDAVIVSFLVWLVQATAAAVRNAYQDEDEDIPEVYPQWAYTAELTSMSTDLQLEFLDNDSPPQTQPSEKVDRAPIWEPVVFKLFQLLVALNFKYTAAVCPPPTALLDATIRHQEAQIRIFSLTLDYATLSSNLDILRTQNAGNQHTISALRNEVVTLDVRLKTSQDEVLHVHGENGKLGEEVKEQQVVIEAQAIKIGEQEACTADVTAQRDEEIEENKALQAKNEELQAKIDGLVEDKARLEGERYEIQQTVNTQRREIILLGQDNISLQENVARGLKALKQQEDNSEEDRAVLIDKSRALNTANINLEGELKTSNEINASLETYIGELKDDHRQRIKAQANSHASQLSARDQQLETARKTAADAERREVQCHIALYEERDTSDAERQRANACATAYVEEKRKNLNLKEVGRSLLVDYAKVQDERDTYKTQLDILRFSILTQPSTEDDDTASTSLVISTSHSSSTSLAVLASTSLDDILAVQLPAITSITSITGLEPYEDLAQACAKIVAPVEVDPFDADPMLVMPTFRFTRSAPPTPSRKTVAERHLGYYVLTPSLSMPIDMDVFG
ncbi:unnamed protein product [Peniophora sp. CBMAI 1063]|nr:unnamed protein product [Peniophora sp. CBMAI 1063]